MAIPIATIIGLTVGAYAAVKAFKAGDPVSSADMNGNFSDLDTRLKAVEGATQVPVGTVVAYAGAAAPAGWLPCDGTSLDGTSAQYALLFSAIGTAHGGNSTSKAFNLPDYRGRFLRGVDNGAARDPDRAARTAANPGGNTGDAVGSAQDQSVGPHSHPVPAFVAFSGGAGGGGYTPGSSPFLAGNGTNNNAGSESRPQNAGVRYIIKY